MIAELRRPLAGAGGGGLTAVLVPDKRSVRLLITLRSGAASAGSIRVAAIRQCELDAGERCGRDRSQRAMG